MSKDQLVDFFESDTLLPYIEPYSLKQIVDTTYHHAKKNTINKAARWLNDIYSQFDITDSGGHPIDIKTFVLIFREKMEEE